MMEKYSWPTDIREGKIIDNIFFEYLRMKTHQIKLLLGIQRSLFCFFRNIGFHAFSCVLIFLYTSTKVLEYTGIKIKRL